MTQQPDNGHELDLLENAFDSLDEAIAKFEEGRSGNSRAFKFALLHLCHWMELLLKFYVAERGEERIFVGRPNADGERRTIGLYDAIEILKADGYPISPELNADLKWAKKLRNNIENYKFEMDLEEVEDAIGRIVHGISEYDTINEFLGIDMHVSTDRLATFEKLAENYYGRLKNAEAEADRLEMAAYAGYRLKEYDMVNWKQYVCPSCKHELMVANDQTSTGYQCLLCGETESFDIEHECDICGEEWTDWELSTEVMDGGEVQRVCPRCRGDAEYVSD